MKFLYYFFDNGKEHLNDLGENRCIDIINNFLKEKEGIDDEITSNHDKEDQNQEEQQLYNEETYNEHYDNEEEACNNVIDDKYEEEINNNEEKADINEVNEIGFNEEEDSNFNSEEEVIFDIDDQSNSFSSLGLDSQEEEVPLKKLRKDVYFCKAYFIDFEFDDVITSTISFTIPTSILPLSVSVVNGFYNSPYLIKCQFDLNQNNFYGIRPTNYQFTNESYGKVFPGSVLVKNRFRKFFNLDYNPQLFYKCQNYVLAPQISIDQKKISAAVSCLVDEGFPKEKAKKALMFCSYDLDQARDYIVSGLLPQNNYPIPASYEECPLFYLILEICEAFFDIGDCCCVCGKELGVYNLKPACCNERNCQFSFLNLGLGSNIIGEIKRDPIATDLIIVLAGAASEAPEKPPVFDPSPESQKISFSKDFFSKLPSMMSICSHCSTDKDLIKFIGTNNFEILRFFILANKAQLITLPKDMRTNIKAKGTQFLITSMSPESELIFREKREKYGVKWLWHGSRVERWYRILHTGLKDLGRTDYQLNGGPWYGDGIYMSDSFNYSMYYCGTPTQNVYTQSCLPKSIQIISLVENAAVKELTGPVTTNEYTQKDESACITRVLFLVDGTKKEDIEYNSLQNPPKVPTLNDVLSHKMKGYI